MRRITAVCASIASPAATRSKLCPLPTTAHLAEQRARLYRIGKQPN